MRREQTCPCCGQPMPQEFPEITGAVRRRVVETIARHPNGIGRARLMDLVYADDPDGGPHDPHTITLHVYFANKQLRGRRIVPTWKGPGALYRLVALR